MASIPSKQNVQIYIPKPECLSRPMEVKEKRLLGAGPSNPSGNVLHALSRPMMGHMHPEIFKVRLYSYICIIYDF